MNLSKTLTWAVSALVMLPLVASANVNIHEAPSRPKNMIIMVGDGMGPAYTSAYRYYQNNPDTEEIEQTVFDRLLVGMASTYPARQSGYVTDSAASATALATGVKTYNGAISVDINKRPLTSIMQMAKQRGMAIGVAVTSQVNHATPAAYLAHNESRRNYEEIAKSYLTADADVILGGGQKYFSEALLEQFKAKGYQHIDDFSQLDSITKGKTLGLFADVQLPWVIDQQDSTQLSLLTQKALDLLSQNEQGFVLLVEGSLIDWAGHNNDIATAMGEMHGFANAIEVVEQFVRANPDTLMVVTADHNTGGLSIGANGEYAWDTSLLQGIKASPAALAEQAIAVDDWQALVNQTLGFDVTTEELQRLSNARMQGKSALETSLKQLIDSRSFTGWTTSGHTGGDVQVFAAGPAADLFKGNQDNTDIAEKMMSLLPRSQ
ncbi:alkaline phosphatase [Shewanella sairae]|uniref:Alkaline phosphatase n=1 Tax=Shewanella sairae TaxID=190310 RepID=A0ABQ4PPQ1_9GAMM|nr:alkaline phosphatase [Shewanella sairae]